ncbi:kyphoscoliosis peptidase [Plakobranchus ocellatus]|uniref:Kyphoscoliosis peptidase n=1 Tax=Plakobranchus ocellatus TaxID=259542 RepID=A0AAV4AKK6_9GAST|nr:kyphoscoliosis peptidase [Plakobranchus ocellatus]
MGCGGSKGNQSGARNDNPPIEEIDVPDIDNRYPAPSPPKSNKDDFYKPSDYANIDTQVKQQLTRIDKSSYESLTLALSRSYSTDLEKLRAIYVWLFHQDVFGAFYSGVTDPYTPRGYMKLIKTGNGSYASFFAQLCRAAGIPCNVIRGVGRGDSYNVGQQDMSELQSAWCAVHVDGNWRLVHPLWAYFTQKQTYIDGRRPPAGTKRPTVNDFFYLIDPNKMICFCLPHADSWQLLKKKWDAKKFVRSPQFTEEYFTSGLLLPRKYNAILQAENGICVIDFDHHAHDEPSIESTIEFDKDSTTESGEGLPANVRMSDYVITSSSSTRKTLVVKFPVKGRYNADVFGGRDSKHPKIVEFRMDCDDTERSPQPFPLRPQGGFGPRSEAASTLGVSDITPDSGIVLVRATQVKHFSFTMTQPLELEANLVHSTASSADLDDFVSCQVTQHQGQVKVVVPEETNLEFGLEINARPANTSRPFSVIATYLLVDENWRKRTAVVAPTKHNKSQQEARKALIAATQKSDIQRLEKAIGDFERLKLSDNGDLTRARHRLVELHLRNLRMRTLERKLDPLDNAIHAAKTSHVASYLINTNEMKDAEATQKQLRRLKLYMHKVLALNKATISEIHRYHRPKPLVHNVMKATFRILGEPKSKIQNWSYIQTCMRQLGRNSMMTRVKQFDPVHLKEGQASDAEGYLDQTNKYLVRMCSAGAGTFYVWSNNMISEYHGKGQVEPLDIWQGNDKWSKLLAKRDKLKDKSQPPNRSDDRQTHKREAEPEVPETERSMYGAEVRRGDSPEEDDWNPNLPPGGEYYRQNEFTPDYDWDPNAPSSGRNYERQG